MKEGGATHKHHQHPTLVHGGFLRIHHIASHYPCALHKYMFHIIERFHTLPAKAHLDAAAGEGALPLRLPQDILATETPKWTHEVSGNLFSWRSLYEKLRCKTYLVPITYLSKYICQRWWNRRIAGKPLGEAVNFQFLNSHHTRTCGRLMPSTKPEWNSFRPLAFLLAVAQVTSVFWWTGVCNELAMWRLQKAFSNSSATHDNERVKCSDLFVGLSLKVSSRLELWQTQTLLVAHATSSISSFTWKILTKTSTKSTQRSTKLWNSKPLPNEETKKKRVKAGTVSALRLSSLLGFGGPPVDTLKKRRDDPRLDQMDSLQRGPGSHPYWLWTCL